MSIQQDFSFHLFRPELKPNQINDNVLNIGEDYFFITALQVKSGEQTV